MGRKGNAVTWAGIDSPSPKWKRLLRRYALVYLMFLIPLAVLILFKYIPMYGAQIAFRNYKPTLGVLESEWVGWKWFLKFFNSTYFSTTICNTLILNLYSICTFPLSLVFALMLRYAKLPRAGKAVQMVSYAPHFISTVVVCGMLVNFLSSDGMINQLVKVFTGTSIQFLMDPKYFRTIYVASGIWQSVGWNSIIYLAALTGVDAEMYEAALIDGANRWHRIWYITLPSIAPTISIMLIMNLGRLMNLGHEKILLLYTGSTYEVADVISTYVYRRGLLGNDFSYATAVGLFQAIVGVILVTSANQISKKLGETSLW